MQDYERKAVSEVVEEINKTYFLPDIQRNFVWKPEQVYALFDSILRDYPIGTFLFWRQKGDFLKSEKIKKLEFVKRSKDNNIENTEVTSAKEYMLVLDGQQRLTTFCLVLKGNYIIRNNPYDLYINLLSGDEERDDGILYEFKFFNNKKGVCFSENGDDLKLWYNIKNVYDFKIGNIFSEVSIVASTIKKNHDVELNDKQKNTIAKLCQYLRGEKIIYYYPEVEKDYDKVLDIFVRTNSGGTPLSYSDLLFSTIKSKWADAREKFDTLLFHINDHERYRFTHDFVLKTILVLNAKSHEEVRYKTKNFKPTLIDKIQNDWDLIEKAISLSVDLLKDKLLLTNHKIITSNNAIIPIIYWVHKNKFKGFGTGKHCINDIQMSSVKMWLIKALLSGIFGGQSDAILYKCKESLDNENTNSFPANNLEQKINSETKKSMKLESDFLDDIRYNSGDSYLILSICYDGAVNFQPKVVGNLPEQDHIFSQDELKKAGIPENKINSIYNIRYIGSTDNRVKSNTPYSEWVRSFKSKEEMEREFNKHLLPKGQWSIVNFDDFLKQRKKLIEEKFRNIP